MRAVNTIENAKCEHCGKSHKNKSLLKKHQRVSHPENGKRKDNLTPCHSKLEDTSKLALSPDEQKSVMNVRNTLPEVKREEAVYMHSPTPKKPIDEIFTARQSICNLSQNWSYRRNSKDVKREVTTHIQNLAHALCEGQRPDKCSSNNYIQSQNWSSTKSSPESRREIQNPMHNLAQAFTEGQGVENISTHSHPPYWNVSKEPYEMKREATPYFPSLPQHISENCWPERLTPSNQSQSWVHSKPPIDFNFPPYYAPPSPSLPTPSSNWACLASYPGQIPPNIWKNWWTPPPS